MSCVDCSGGCNSYCDSSCKGGCEGGCNETCASACNGVCRDDCVGTCSGSCGGCASGCTGTCSGQCNTTCLGSCSGSCLGTCQGGCQGCTGCRGTCQNQCDNACTAANQAENIANIGQNILLHGIIKAADFIELKNAIKKEYERRKKVIPPEFSPPVIPGEQVKINAILQVFDDCYNFNASSANDWRGTVKAGDPVLTAKIEPCIQFIKTLSTQITVS